MNEKRYITKDNIDTERSKKVISKLNKKNIIDNNNFELIIGDDILSLILTENELIAVNAGKPTNYSLHYISKFEVIGKVATNLVINYNNKKHKLKFILTPDDIAVLGKYINLQDSTSNNAISNKIVSLENETTTLNKPFYKKKLFLIPFVLLIFIGILNGTSKSGDEQQSNVNDDTNNTVLESKKDNNIDYTIISEDDVSFANTVRLTVNVLIEPGDYSKTDLENLLITITNEYISTHSVNALAVYVADSAENMNNYTWLARSDYAPYGDWEKAMDVKTGDYSSFDYTFFIN